MAEKTKSTKKQPLKFLLTAVLSIGGCYILSEVQKQKEKPQPFSDELYDVEGENIVSKKILIKEGSPVYGTLTDTINENNKRTPYYDESLERYVMTAFYECNNQFIRIDMEKNFREKETEIINNNGKLVAVLTTVDPNTRELEAFYNAKNIKVLQLVMNKTK